MSNPLIINRSPAHRSFAGVTDKIRFSLRDPLSRIYRNGAKVWVGSGPAFYDGEDLPENRVGKSFELDVWSGMSEGEAIREMTPNGLKITKMGTDNLKGLYYFGGLEAPAAPDDPLMGEFTLRLNSGDVTPVSDFTGVLFGIFINNGGFTLRFMLDGFSVPSVEFFDIMSGTTQRILWPSTQYKSLFNWADGGTYTYKILWHPTRNLVQLWVLEEDAVASDDTAALLIEGQVSDFPTFSPTLYALRANQPWGVFGHGLATAESISCWKAASLHNLVEEPVFEGVPGAGLQAVILSDDIVHYRADALPFKARAAWNKLTSEIYTIEGSENLSNGVLRLDRRNDQASYGYFRKEPRGAVPVIIDFEAKGFLEYLRDGQESSGMELYWDDLTKAVRLAFLLSNNTQYIGLHRAGDEKLLTSYLTFQEAWIEFDSYRLLVDPVQDIVRVIQFVSAGGSFEELEVISTDYAGMPPSLMLGRPGVGFLHNGLAANAQGSLFIRAIRYGINVRAYECDVVPPAAWTQMGGTIADSVTSDGTELTINKVSATPLFFYRTEANLNAAAGCTVEFGVRISSFSVGTDLSPIRLVVGPAVAIDDGARQYGLAFAEAGPDLNKILFLVTDLNLDANLLKIRAGDPSVEGTYFSIDWSVQHIYRFERQVGGNLSVFVDNNSKAFIEFDLASVPGTTPSLGVHRVYFGTFLPGVKCCSIWRHVRYTVSEGLDVEVMVGKDLVEVAQRFDHAVNTIVVAEGV